MVADALNFGKGPGKTAWPAMAASFGQVSHKQGVSRSELEGFLTKNGASAAYAQSVIGGWDKNERSRHDTTDCATLDAAVATLARAEGRADAVINAGRADAAPLDVMRSQLAELERRMGSGDVKSQNRWRVEAQTLRQRIKASGGANLSGSERRY